MTVGAVGLGAIRATNGEPGSVPPGLTLPQAHLQPGHVALLGAFLSLVLLSLPTLWMTFDIGKEPLPRAQERQAEEQKP